MTIASYGMFRRRGQYQREREKRVRQVQAVVALLAEGHNCGKTIPKKLPIHVSNEQAGIEGLISIAVVAGLAVSQLNLDLPHQAPEEVLRFRTCVVHDGLPYPVASSFCPSPYFVWPGSLLLVVPLSSSFRLGCHASGHIYRDSESLFPLPLCQITRSRFERATDVLPPYVRIIQAGSIPVLTWMQPYAAWTLALQKSKHGNFFGAPHPGE